MKKNALFIIDPQFDFVSPFGALPVKGATKDMDNTARFIRTHQNEIGYIQISGDAHNHCHISHPTFWRDGNGKMPEPFTVINASDFGKNWFPIRDDTWTDYYLNKIESFGRKHVIWPIHCQANTPGACFVPEIVEAVNEWEEATKLTCSVITKGHLWHTEQHSPFSYAFGEMVNIDKLVDVKDCPVVYFAGEAYSHCLKDAVVDALGIIDPKKVVILTNCTSAIEGYDMTAFENEYKAKGVRFLNTSEV